jgi:hypothetical protein
LIWLSDIYHIQLPDPLRIDMDPPAPVLLMSWRGLLDTFRI